MKIFCSVFNHEMMQNYFQSVIKYGTELIARIGEHFGVDMAEFRSNAEANNQDIAQEANMSSKPTA